MAIVRVKPQHYIHVTDNNIGVSKLIEGPVTYVKRDNEVISEGPSAMVRLPPRHYCQVANPVVRDAKGEVLHDTFTVGGKTLKQARLQRGDTEIRLAQDWKDPFPLYPGETLKTPPQEMQVVRHDQAIRLRATRDFQDGDVTRAAGDEWVCKGPVTYTPRKEVDVVTTIKAIVVKPNGALKIRATADTTDSTGVKRMAGEEWLVRSAGAYLPSVDEEVLETLKAEVLTEMRAVQLRALASFTDVYKIKRRAGAEWLVTIDMAETHICEVHEELVNLVNLTTLTHRQFCMVADPIDDSGVQHFGKVELRKGEAKFFLKPGEKLEGGVQDVVILTEDDHLLLRALKEFTDATKTKRKAGENWLISGPCDFIPPVEVEIVERRNTIPLEDNEGVYVRDLNTGRVEMFTGKTLAEANQKSLVLQPHQRLWEKELPLETEKLVFGAPRVDRTLVVTVKAAHNTAMQVFDYKTKESRVVFGPDMVMLGPDEDFTVLSLSGGKPKKQDAFRDVALQLGPELSRDILLVETKDHARLAVKLGYNWYFDVSNKSKASKLFTVRDFVGDMCMAIASRVRACVAATAFDEFHKHSGDIIQAAVFGRTESGEVATELRFPANNLVVSAVDVQSVEPTDSKTADSLFKSVQQAIEITAQAQEMAARNDRNRMDQKNAGQLMRQQLKDQIRAETEKQQLLKCQAETRAVETCGTAVAEAKARMDAHRIEGESEVEQAALRAQAMATESVAEVEGLRKRHEAERKHQADLYELELSRAKELAAIEAKKFTETVQAFGQETIIKIAKSGPELQGEMLKNLGVQNFILSDGTTPLNLFTGQNSAMAALSNRV